MLPLHHRAPIYKYLGILFSYNGRFREEQLELKDQSTRAMYPLIGNTRKYDLPIDIQLQMYSSMAVEVTTYACKIWGFDIVREMESLQMRFLKYILCVQSRTVRGTPGHLRFEQTDEAPNQQR